MRDHGHTRDVNTIANIDMPHQTNPARQHAMLADFSASRDTNTRSHRRVVADLHVVGNLNLVVQFDAIANSRISQRTPIDCRIDADLDVITEGDATDLCNLVVDTFILGKAKALPPSTAPDWMTTRLPMRTSW